MLKDHKVTKVVYLVLEVLKVEPEVVVLKDFKVLEALNLQGLKVIKDHKDIRGVYLVLEVPKEGQEDKVLMDFQDLNLLVELVEQVFKVEQVSKVVLKDHKGVRD